MERLIVPSTVLGALLGVVFGILLLIPFVAPFIFFLLFVIAGIIVLIIMKKNNYIGVITLQEGCFVGALSGFSSLVTASAIFIPVKFLLDKAFNHHSVVSSVSQSLSVRGYDILAVSILVFSTALLSALFNAFSGLITAYVIEKRESKYISFADHLDVEQVDEEIS